MARVRFTSKAQRPLLYLAPILICITMWIPAEGLHALSAKASLLRFWRRELPNVTLPAFLLNKASPLNATSMALFSSLLEHNTLTPSITSFCAAADLLCESRAYAYSTAVSGSDSINSHFLQYPVNGGLQRNEWFHYANVNGQFPRYNVDGDSFGNYGAGGVEPGMFFRESKLKSGTEMPLPDLKDYTVPRSFLPRSLADKFPVTSASLPGLLKLFQIPQNSPMERIMRDTVYECESAPAKGETKRCVTSVEGMVEFAKQVLGARLQLMTTASSRGSRHNVIIGAVSEAAGGALTRSVTCHQGMFPFLMYYCHSVPQVRVYEADMLSSSSSRGQEQEQNNNIINHGVSICHIDTSGWSPKHAAFQALGGKPGGIEVCHWIFQGGLIWVPTSS